SFPLDLLLNAIVAGLLLGGVEAAQQEAGDDRVEQQVERKAHGRSAHGWGAPCGCGARAPENLIPMRPPLLCSFVPWRADSATPLPACGERSAAKRPGEGGSPRVRDR